MSSEKKTAYQRFNDKKNELDHYIKRSLGQNFLISDHVIDKIIQAVQSENPQNLLEIGPGLGAITDILKQYFTNYSLIEMDSSLVEYWKNQGFSVIAGDALQIDWQKINYDVLVSNLPYQISSSIVIERSLDQNRCRSMILMFQKEVAQRIRAIAKSEHYGLLSVIAQEFWSITTVCEAGPKDFNPAPKVASRVLKFIKKETNIEDPKEYLFFIKECFKQRRRILKSNLHLYDNKKLMLWFEIEKLTDKVRAEELTVSQFNKLYQHMKNSRIN